MQQYFLFVLSYVTLFSQWCFEGWRIVCFLPTLLLPSSLLFSGTFMILLLWLCPGGYWGFTAPLGCSRKHWALGNCQCEHLVTVSVRLLFDFEIKSASCLLVNLLPRCRRVNIFKIFFIFRDFVHFFILRSEIDECHFQSWHCVDCTTLNVNWCLFAF